MNDVMSGGIHRLWKDYFIQKLHPAPSVKLLDVAGGTGMLSLSLSFFPFFLPSFLHQVLFFFFFFFFFFPSLSLISFLIS